MRKFTAVLLGKTILKVLRAAKLGGGSAAPGLYALKIHPKLIEDLSSRITKNVIITGTNGKTTTSRMLAQIATQAGLRVIRNHTGSNLERGIASALIAKSHLGGNLAWHLGIWEVDEAAFNTVAPKLKPKIIVFLNAFRDQLDRYGEVDSIVKNWVQTLKELPKETIILVNGDDANTSKLKRAFKGKVETFGVENFKIIGEKAEEKNSKQSLDFEAKNIKQNGLNGSNFELTIHNLPYMISLPVPGVYHIYNATSALLTAYHLGLSIHKAVDTVKTYKPAFGRMEKFSLQSPRLHRKVNWYIFLIKNPAGASQVFETIAPHLKKEDRLFLALNDNFADGKDVSWIWDAQFEKFFEPKNFGGSRGVNTVLPPRRDIVVSGTRALDLAVRLKYADMPTNHIIVEPDLKRALKEAEKGLKGNLYIFPTYTAMLSLQKILTKSGIKKHYWEEER